MTVEDFIDCREHPHIQQLLIHADALIRGLLPAVQASIKWKVPVYHYRKNLCYLNPKKDHLDLGFMQGVQLSNEQGLLVGTGKQVRHIKLYTIEDIYKEAVSEVILEAALLNEAKV